MSCLGAPRNAVEGADSLRAEPSLLNRALPTCLSSVLSPSSLPFSLLLDTYIGLSCYGDLPRTGLTSFQGDLLSLGPPESQH